MRNSERLKICQYMCVFRTEIPQFRFLRHVTGEAPTEHISYSDLSDREKLDRMETI